MEKLAIIGTGISGMGAAYFLRDKFDIVFYDKNDYAGGHTNTLTIDEEGQSIFIDSAFMVYNEKTYPLLTRLFKSLNVKTKETDMSFSVQHKATNLEYCGTGLSGLFAQRRNLFSIKHWKMLLQMDRFNKESIEVLETDQYNDYSLQAYIKEKGYSDDFFHKFLVPISSAVWSSPPDKMLEFPAVTLIRFFKNHGFLGLRGHYQWRTVVDGSQRYRDKIMSMFSDRVKLNAKVTQVERLKDKVAVTDKSGEKVLFDKVVMASHADETFEILRSPTEKETKLLSRFSYQNNRATLHTDESVMPRCKEAWSSWNYLIDDKGPSTIYWMNNLQHVSDKKNYFVSINDTGNINPDKILWERDYSHPIYNVPAIEAQKSLSELNETGPIYYCGSYFKYGFHEDGLWAGLNAARAITGEEIWS